MDQIEKGTHMTFAAVAIADLPKVQRQPNGYNADTAKAVAAILTTGNAAVSEETFPDETAARKAGRLARRFVAYFAPDLTCRVTILPRGGAFSFALRPSTKATPEA